MATSEPDPTKVVADADVLAADLFVDGAARQALDHVREHSWMTLVASDQLIDDAAAIIAALADDTLATDWRAKIEDVREDVEHPPGDHPGLASAYRSGAGHVLTFEEHLRSAEAGANIRKYMDASLRHPDAFARLFDAESLYEAYVGEEYPGPDQDPRK